MTDYEKVMLMIAILTLIINALGLFSKRIDADKKKPTA